MASPEWSSAYAGWASAVFSGLAFIISIISLVVSRTAANKQTLLAKHTWSDDYFREVAAWANEVAHCISKCIHMIGVDDEGARRDVLATLSACIDTGRWYFPNHSENDVGTGKPPAYRGLRQPLLDWVVFAYDVCDRNDQSEAAKFELIDCQRNFISAMQEVLDPRSRNDAIAKILNDFGPVSSMPKIQSPAKQ